MPIIPTIHMNGDTRDTLLNDYLAQRKAVITAIKALQAHPPHARNYYPEGMAAFTKAQDEHRERIAALKHVTRELEEILEAISNKDGA